MIVRSVRGEAPLKILEDPAILAIRGLELSRALTGLFGGTELAAPSV
jgi:hypothetical protein